MYSKTFWAQAISPVIWIILKSSLTAFINMKMMDQKLPSYDFNDRPVFRFQEAVKEILKMYPDSGWWSEINIMTASIKFINVTMCNWISSCMSCKTFKPEWLAFNIQMLTSSSMMRKTTFQEQLMGNVVFTF